MSRCPLRLNPVSYKGMASALTDLIAGNVVFMFGNLVPTLPHERLGALGFAPPPQFMATIKAEMDKWIELIE